MVLLKSGKTVTLDPSVERVLAPRAKTAPPGTLEAILGLRPVERTVAPPGALTADDICRLCGSERPRDAAADAGGPGAYRQAERTSCAASLAARRPFRGRRRRRARRPRKSSNARSSSLADLSSRRRYRQAWAAYETWLATAARDAAGTAVIRVEDVGLVSFRCYAMGIRVPVFSLQPAFKRRFGWTQPSELGTTTRPLAEAKQTSCDFSTLKDAGCDAATCAARVRAFLDAAGAQGGAGRALDVSCGAGPRPRAVYPRCLQDACSFV